jgi:D-3-phosphoglycerate dehydrogenase / 2-oxoglutarate reductase
MTMTNSRVLITDCDHENINIEADILNNASIPFELKQCKTEQDLIELGRGAKVFINQYAPITEQVLAQLPDLRLVVRYGVGVNNVDLHAATKYGVQICNVPDYGTNEVADHALALMLALTRKITVMNHHVHNGVWDYRKSIPIFRHSEQTVGIIGVGRIGLSFAKRVKALGCKVIGFDPKYFGEKAKQIPDFIELVQLKELFERSDIVSIHCPLDHARDLVGESELRRMKQTAYLINVSRGGIINESALKKALQERWIAGAAIDVADVEPLTIDSGLLRHEQFICTPHMAWYSEQAANELKRKVAEEAVRFLSGQPVRYRVNGI